MVSSGVFENACIDEVEEYYRKTLVPENRPGFKNLDDAASLGPLLDPATLATSYSTSAIQLPGSASMRQFIRSTPF